MSDEQSAAFPIPTKIYRFFHYSNLHTILARGGMHATNYIPDDKLEYRCIHNLEIQQKRAVRSIRCGPGGVIHDYVPFYFGPLSPMLFMLKTGNVRGYSEGQTPITYAVTTVQAVIKYGLGYVFSDGHGIASYTAWYSDIEKLDVVDWAMVGERYWSDNLDDPDRQRRKQAEFLIHKFCPWILIERVAVISLDMKQMVEKIFRQYPDCNHPPVAVERGWYY